MSDDHQRADNRDKKVAGRAKRRRYVQGTRAYTHAVLNSIARRAGLKAKKPGKEQT
jgi:protein-disulfide isomerase-like protein with CxxC motif